MEITLVSGVTTTWGTVWNGPSIRKVGNGCIMALGNLEQMDSCNLVGGTKPWPCPGSPGWYKSLPLEVLSFLEPKQQPPALPCIDWYQFCWVYFAFCRVRMWNRVLLYNSGLPQSQDPPSTGIIDLHKHAQLSTGFILWNYLQEAHRASAKGLQGLQDSNLLLPHTLACQAVMVL